MKAFESPRLTGQQILKSTMGSDIGTMNYLIVFANVYQKNILDKTQILKMV